MSIDPSNIAYGAIAAWLINKLWDSFSGTQKELVTETKALTFAIIELKADLKSLNEKIAEIPALRKDVNSIGAKVRGLQSLQEKPQQ